MSDLRSATVPPIAEADHVRGPATAPALIQYGDLECAYCARLHLELEQLRERHQFRLVFRHFPIRSAHPRAWAAACAVEAAGLQNRFWEMHDALLGDQAHLEDPHLWRLAEALALNVARFDRDRRSSEVGDRVMRDFHGGVRAGVVTVPTMFWDGRALAPEQLRSIFA